jgi:hypothetical protein
MQTSHLALICAACMSLSAGLVYAATPNGGFEQPDAADDAIAEAETAPEDADFRAIGASPTAFATASPTARATAVPIGPHELAALEGRSFEPSREAPPVATSRLSSVGFAPRAKAEAPRASGVKRPWSDRSFVASGTPRAPLQTESFANPPPQIAQQQASFSQMAAKPPPQMPTSAPISTSTPEFAQPLSTSSAMPR